jgi:hypothetical protein
VSGAQTRTERETVDGSVVPPITNPFPWCSHPPLSLGRTHDLLLAKSIWQMWRDFAHVIKALNQLIWLIKMEMGRGLICPAESPWKRDWILPDKRSSPHKTDKECGPPSWRSPYDKDFSPPPVDSQCPGSCSYRENSANLGQWFFPCQASKGKHNLDKYRSQGLCETLSRRPSEPSQTFEPQKLCSDKCELVETAKFLVIGCAEIDNEYKLETR